MGDIIYYYAEKDPNINFTVLGGHTHTEKEVRLRSNLEIRIASAEYRNPRPFAMLEIYSNSPNSILVKPIDVEEPLRAGAKK